jgi:NIPSNAP protein
MPYDVTILTLRPGVAPKALAGLQNSLPQSPGKLLACWSSDIGALNQIFVLREYASERETAEQRDAQVHSDNPFGIAEFIASTTSDTYVSFPFIDSVQPGAHGPFFEVRTYLMKPNGLAGTIEAWRKALPARLALSPVLAAMYSVSGLMPRFMHIWPYTSLDERHRIRAQAVAMGIWPPPGGPDRLVTMKNDIYLPVSFSPIK